MLQVEHISKSFGGIQALKDVSLTVGDGEIVALVGPNGAGKTTLFSTISGFLAPDQGRVTFDSRPITALPPHRISRHGLVRTFQITQPFGALTVQENIAVGAYMAQSSRKAALEQAGSIGRMLGLGRLLSYPATSLTIANRKRLEVARALATGPKLILLDEVFAGLNPTEVDEILPVIARLRENGLGILLTEHVLQAVRKLADRVVVMNNGSLIAQGHVDEVFQNPAVISAYLGRPANTPAAAGEVGHA